MSFAALLPRPWQCEQSTCQGAVCSLLCLQYYRPCNCSTAQFWYSTMLCPTDCPDQQSAKQATNRNATNQFDPKWRPSRQQWCRTSTELQAVPLTMGHEHEQGTTFQQNCCCTVTLLFTYHSYWDCQAVHMQSESICCCYVVAIWLTFPAGVFLNQTT